MGLLVASVNAAMVMGAALLEQGNLNALPLALLGQALALPMLFGALSQAIAYRRAIKAFAERKWSRAIMYRPSLIRLGYGRAVIIGTVKSQSDALEPVTLKT